MIWPFNKKAPEPEPKAKPEKGRIRGMTVDKSAEDAAPRVEPYEPPPGVIPKDQEKWALAQDSVPYDYINQMMSNSSFVGYYFPGYQNLSQLAQLPEYRKMSEALAREMTREWIKLHSTGDDDKSDKISVIEDQLQKHGIRDTFQRAAELDGFFGRAQLYIDVRMPNGGNPQDNPQELASPLSLNPAKVKKGSLKGFKLIEPIWTYPAGYNADNPMSQTFYKPQKWFVMGSTIHDSRLLKFESREVPDLLKPAYNFGGVSMSQMARPYVENWIKTRDSVSELIHSFSTSGIKTDMSSVLTGADDADFFNRAKLFSNLKDNKGLMLLDKDSEEFFQFNTPLSGLSELQAQSQEHMSSVSNLPLTIFTGITPSGLNACLPAQTLIETDRGQVPIRDVTTADQVMTRQGYAPLTFSGVTQYTQELIEICTESRTLQCTANHPIWLPSTNEFVRAENVRSGDRLLLIGEKDVTRKTPRQSHGEVSGGGNEPMGITLRGIETKSAPFSFIGRFGKRIADQYLNRFIFTTSTTTKRTTRSTILSRCIRRITWPTIASTTLKRRDPRPKQSTAISAGSRSLSKSSPAERSFVRTHAFWKAGESAGLPLPSRPLYASVEDVVPTLLRCEKTQNSVRADVRAQVRIDRHTSRRIIGHTLKSLMVPSVKRAVPKYEAFQKNVLDAGKRLFRSEGKTSSIARNRARIARDRDDTGIVKSVKRVPTSEWVYDLSVASGYLPEFYANGILTHNSSDGEIRVHYDYVHSMQEIEYRTPLETVIKLIQLDQFGEIDPEIDFQFEPLYGMDELQQSQVRANDAQADVSYVSVGALSPDEVRQRLADDPDSGYDGLDVDEGDDTRENELEGSEREGGDPEKGDDPDDDNARNNVIRTRARVNDR